MKKKWKLTGYYLNKGDVWELYEDESGNTKKVKQKEITKYKLTEKLEQLR